MLKSVWQVSGCLKVSHIAIIRKLEDFVRANVAPPPPPCRSVDAGTELVYVVETGVFKTG